MNSIIFSFVFPMVPLYTQKYQMYQIYILSTQETERDDGWSIFCGRQLANFYRIYFFQLVIKLKFLLMNLGVWVFFTYVYKMYVYDERGLFFYLNLWWINPKGHFEHGWNIHSNPPNPHSNLSPNVFVFYKNY